MSSRRKKRSASNRFERYPRATTAAILMLSVFIGVPIADVFFTCIPKVRSLVAAIRGRTGRPPEKLRIEHPVFHHGMRALGSTLEPNGTRVTTNSLGMRDRTMRRVPLKSSRYRVLFIGDSFMEGHGVDYDFSWYAQVEKRLDAMGIDSLNAGVGSYAPSIYYAKVKYLVEHEGLKFDELVVSIDLSDIQDETFYYLDKHDNVQSRYQHAQLIRRYDHGYDKPLANFLFEYTTLGGRLLERWVDFKVGRVRELRDEYAVTSKRSLWTVSPFLQDEYANLGTKRAVEHMNLLKEYLDARNIPLTVVVYPWPDQIYFNDLDSIHVRTWETWSQLNSAEFINVFPAFVKPGQDVLAAIRENYIPGDCHWTQEGNRKTAEAFWKEFRPRVKERVPRASRAIAAQR